jgi:hypothetical protein
MAKRERVEICRAVIRLDADGEKVPVADLADAAQAAPMTLQRWIVEGKRGVFLDGVHDPVRRCWCSSHAALRRFQKKLGQLPPADRQHHKRATTEQRKPRRDQTRQAERRLRHEHMLPIETFAAEGVAPLLTIQQWIVLGVGASPGQRLHLDGTQRDGVWWTSVEALTRFRDAMAALNGEQSQHAEPHGFEMAPAVEGGGAA